MKVRSWTGILDQQPMILLGVIVLVAAVLRFYHLGVQPLWLDEALTWLYAGTHYQGAAGQDIHPPLYFSLMRVWLHGVPGLGLPALAPQASEFFLRAPSALFGVLTVPLVYSLGRRLGGQWPGMLAALFFAVAPFQVRYAQEARMYALLTFLAVLVVWGLSGLLSVPGVASDVSGQPALRTNRAAWAALVGGSLAALYTHNMALLLVVSWNLVLFVCWVSGNLIRPGPGWRWPAACATVVAGWSPWLPRLFGQAREVLSDYWIPVPDLNRLMDTLAALYLPVSQPRYLVSAAALLVTGLWAVGLWRWRRNPASVILVLVLVVAPLAGVLVASLVQPVLLARTLIWTTIPCYLGLASGVLWLKGPRLQVSLVAALVALNLWGLAHYYTVYQKESWNVAADFVAANASSGDVILIHKNYVKEPFNYYFRRYDIDLPQFPLPNDGGEREALIQSLPPHRRIWLVASHGPRDELFEVLGAIVKVGKFREEKPLVGINVFLFDAL